MKCAFQLNHFICC